MRWTLRVKLKLTVVLGASVALFAAIGYPNMPRRDPRGPFVIGELIHPGMDILMLAAMALAVALLAALLLGRDLPHVAWLAVGAGWAGLALRSWPIDSQLMYLRSGHRVFYGRLLAEVGLYFAITGLVALLAQWVGSLLHRRPQPAEPGDPTRTDAMAPSDEDMPDELSSLVIHAGATTLVATLVYLLLLNHSPGTGLPGGPIPRGQILFALVGGFFLGALGSHMTFPTRSPWGVLLALPLTATLFCTFALVTTAAKPPSEAFLAPVRTGQVMPLDIFGLGLPAAMAAYLTSFRVAEVRRETARAAEGH